MRWSEALWVGAGLSVGVLAGLLREPLGWGAPLTLGLCGAGLVWYAWRSGRSTGVQSIEAMGSLELAPPVTESLLTEIGESLQSQLRVELVPQVEECLRTELQEEVRRALRAELAEAVKATLRTELQREVQAGLREELADDVRSTLRTDLQSQVQEALRAELAEGVKATLHMELQSEVQAALRAELADEVRATLRSELKGEVQARLKAELTDEVTGALRAELVSELRGEVLLQLRADLEPSVRQRIELELRPLIRAELRTEAPQPVQDPPEPPIRLPAPSAEDQAVAAMDAMLFGQDLADDMNQARPSVQDGPTWLTTEVIPLVEGEAFVGVAIPVQMDAAEVERIEDEPPAALPSPAVPVARSATIQVGKVRMEMRAGTRQPPEPPTGEAPPPSEPIGVFAKATTYQNGTISARQAIRIQMSSARNRPAQ